MLQHLQLIKPKKVLTATVDYGDKVNEWKKTEIRSSPLPYKMSRASVPWSIKSNLVQTANVLFPAQEEMRFVTTALQIKLCLIVQG